MRHGAFLAAAVLLAGCANRAGPGFAAPSGWSLRTNGLGEQEAHWADGRGRLTVLVLCARAVPELVVQVIDQRSTREAEPMSLWAAGHRWALTARRAEFYVEGRLPLTQGVREELLGAGELRVAAPNLRGQLVLPPSARLGELIADCRRQTSPTVSIQPAAPRP